MQSTKYSLNLADLHSLVRGLLITLAGALLVWLLKVLPNIDFGSYTPFVVPLAAFLVNTCLKYIDGLPNNG